MALADTVTGDGTVLSSGNDMGSYSQTILVRLADGSTKSQIATTTYTDVRSETKWYALSRTAITTWETTNAATTAYSAQCVNEVIGAWELTVFSVVRTITGFTLADAPEA